MVRRGVADGGLVVCWLDCGRDGVKVIAIP